MVDLAEKHQSKQTFYPLLSTGSTRVDQSTQVDPSRQDWKIVDSDVKNQAMQIKTNKPNAPTLSCQAQLSLTVSNLC